MTALARTALAALLAFAATGAAGQTIERIRESGEIRLGFRTDAAPLSHLEGENQPSGYSPEVCARVAELLAIDLDLDELFANFIPVTTGDRFDKVETGEIDLLCGAATVTIGRREQVDFSIPTFVDGTAVLLPKGSDREFSALGGKSVGVAAGTTTEAILATSLEAAGVDAELVTFPSHEEGLAALRNGDVAAYFGDQSILYGLITGNGMTKEFVMSDNTLSVEKQGFALQRGDADFRLAVDRALSQLYANGTMAEMFRASFPGAEPGPALRAMYLLAPELP